MLGNNSNEVHQNELQKKYKWVQHARKGDRVIYAVATHLLDGGHNDKIKALFWKFYREGLVMLVQKKVKTDGTLHSYFEYHAIRTATPFKESWKI